MKKNLPRGLSCETPLCDGCGLGDRSEERERVQK